MTEFFTVFAVTMLEAVSVTAVILAVTVMLKASSGRIVNFLRRRW